MPTKKLINSEKNNNTVSGSTKPGQQEPKKRGRPKGSKNTTIRKDHDIQSNSGTGKNTITTRFAMELNRLPKIDVNNPEQVKTRIEEYFSICSLFDLKPTIAMLAVSFRVSRITLFNWLNNRNDTLQNSESVNAIKEAYNIINGLYETYLTEGSIIPVSSFFLMKNNMGYKDTTDYIVTANQDKQLKLSDITDRSGLLSE